MAEEKILHLSEEDDVTSVRERLKSTQAQKIILVIPRETKLRTKLSWQLLYRETLDLKKEARIISPDVHIRGIAAEAGFKTSMSKKASSPGKTRAGTNASSTTGRKAPPRRRETSMRPSGTLRQPPSPQSAQPLQDIPTITDLPSTTMGKEERRERGEPNLPPTPPTYGAKGKQYGPFHVENAPSHPLRPVNDMPEDDEDDWVEQKYQEAQNFRQSVSANPPDTMEPPERIPVSDQQTKAAQTFEPFSQEEPLSTIGDMYSPSSLPEQHARRAFVGDEHSAHDLHSGPADSSVGADLSRPHTPGKFIVEDVSEPDTIVFHPGNLPSTPLQEEQGGYEQQDWQQGNWRRPEKRFEPGNSEFSPSNGVPGPQRAGSRGYISSIPSQSRSAHYENDDELLAPTSEQQTQMMPPPSPVRPPRLSGKLPATENSRTSFIGPFKPPTPVTMPRPGSKQSRPGAPPQKSVPKTQQSNRGHAGAGPLVPPSRPMKQPAQAPAAQKKKRNGWVSVPIALLILLLLGLLAYVGPSADVTVFLPSKSFSLPVKLTANTANATTGSSTHALIQPTVPAELLKSQPITLTGKGQATGTTKVGKNKATGKVVITNNGTQQVEVPTGTVVATSKGVQFVTTADVVILTAGSNVGNKNVTTIEAVNPGEIGNVGANSILTISSDSYTNIQQLNPGVTINLSITNTDPTTGGGTGNATAVSNSDVQAEQATLTKQLQSQVQTWLKQQLHPGDEAGQPVLNESITARPSAGNTTPDGTFSATLTAHPTLLVVRASEIQKAALAQLNTAVSKSKQYQGYTVVPSQPVKVTSLKNTPGKDGNSLLLSFTAIGQIVPQQIEQELPGLVAGKAVSSLPKGQKENGTQHYRITNPDLKANSAYKTLDTTISVSPGFWKWVAFLTSRITVHVVPVPGK